MVGAGGGGRGKLVQVVDKSPRPQKKSKYCERKEKDASSSTTS
jgi:hypothetical protein